MSIVNLPIGYRIEFRPGDFCFYSPHEFRREALREGGRIHSLHAYPLAGCPPVPVAARGKHWCEWKHWAANAYMDPTAAPVYLGPELHDPARREQT